MEQTKTIWRRRDDAPRIDVKERNICERYGPNMGIIIIEIFDHLSPSWLKLYFRRHEIWTLLFCNNTHTEDNANRLLSSSLDLLATTAAAAAAANDDEEKK